MLLGISLLLPLIDGTHISPARSQLGVILTLGGVLALILLACGVGHAATRAPAHKARRQSPRR